jgi:SAM-dependent methyltransferase
MFATEREVRDFSAFEQQSWVRLSAHYDTLAGRITQQATQAVLDAAGVRPGMRVLDVATGPGYVAARAAQMGAEAVGVDFSADMVADSRRRFPGLTVAMGDAQALDFADVSFDAVVCAFGLLHMPLPGRAVAEAKRVLRPGGRLAWTVWQTGPSAKFFGTIAQVIQQYADPSLAPPPGPSQFALSDPWISLALMEAAGFTEVRVEEVASTFTPDGPGEVVEFMRKCTVRGADTYARQVPEVQALIRAALEEAARAAMAEGGGAIPCPALLVSGTRQ